MDATSTTLCKDNNIPIIVFSMDIPGNITKAAKGEEIGTIVRGEQFIWKLKNCYNKQKTA